MSEVSVPSTKVARSRSRTLSILSAKPQNSQGSQSPDDLKPPSPLSQKIHSLSQIKDPLKSIQELQEMIGSLQEIPHKPSLDRQKALEAIKPEPVKSTGSLHASPKTLTSLNFIKTVAGYLKRDVDDLTSEERNELAIFILGKSSEVRTKKDITALMKCLSGVEFFQQYDQITTENCLKRMNLKYMPKGSRAFDTNSEEKNFWVIIKGSAEAFIYTPLDRDIAKKKLFEHKMLSSGMSFGEMVLLEDSPQSATVICKEDCFFAVLQKEDYVDILRQKEMDKVEAEIDFLAGLPLFKEWSRNAVKNILFNIPLEKFQRGNTVFSEGEKSLKMYIVKRGEFKITKRVEVQTDQDPVWKSKLERIRIQPVTKKPIEIGILSEGEIFGEEGLLNDTKREFSITCNSLEADVYAIDRRFLNHRILTFDSSSKWLKSHIKGKLEYYDQKIKSLCDTAAQYKGLLMFERKDYTKETLEVHITKKTTNPQKLPEKGLLIKLITGYKSKTEKINEKNISSMPFSKYILKDSTIKGKHRLYEDFLQQNRKSPHLRRNQSNEKLSQSPVIPKHKENQGPDFKLNLQSASPKSFAKSVSNKGSPLSGPMQNEPLYNLTQQFLTLTQAPSMKTREGGTINQIDEYQRLENELSPTGSPSSTPKVRGFSVNVDRLAKNPKGILVSGGRRSIERGNYSERKEERTRDEGKVFLLDPLPSTLKVESTLFNGSGTLSPTESRPRSRMNNSAEKIKAVRIVKGLEKSSPGLRSTRRNSSTRTSEAGDYERGLQSLRNSMRGFCSLKEDMMSLLKIGGETKRKGEETERQENIHMARKRSIENLKHQNSYEKASVRLQREMLVQIIKGNVNLRNAINAEMSSMISSVVVQDKRKMEEMYESGPEKVEERPRGFSIKLQNLGTGRSGSMTERPRNSFPSRQSSRQSKYRDML